MAKAHKRKDGSWYGAVYMGKDIYNKKIYKFVYAPKEKECNQKIRELEYKRDNNLLTETIKSESITIEDYWNEWLKSRVGLADSTLREYESVARKHLPKIMKMNAKDLNYKVVQKLYNDIYIENNNNPKIVKKVARLFNCFLRKMAVDRSCPIPRDILDGLELPSCPKIKHYKITDTVYKDIMKNLKQEYKEEESNIQYLYPIAMTISHGGPRIGEATAIFIDDVNEDNNTITINKQQLPIKGHGYVIVEKTKTDAGNRVIVMDTDLRAFLHNHIKKQQKLIEDLKALGFQPQMIKVIKSDGTIKYVESWKLLITTNDGRMVKKNTVQRNWKEFRESIGYEDQIRLHDLRRFCATQLMRAGVPDTIAKSQLGHTAINMTQYYQDDTEELKQDYISKISY